MEEYSDMCEKIIQKLHHLITFSPEIHEFSIIPTPENVKNKSPVLYEQNCLGLESWCKKYLLKYTHNLLLKIKKSKCENIENLNHLLITVLLLQPDIPTFWNMKRELVQSNVLNVDQELVFSRIVLTHHSKCSEIFSYRRWLISKNPNLNVLCNELPITEFATEKSKNNYHAWNHRIWCLEKILDKHPSVSDVISGELMFSLQWITKHISENIGYFYRQTVINYYANSKSCQFNIFHDLDVNSLVKFFKLSTSKTDSLDILHFLLGKSNIFPILEDCPNYVDLLMIYLNDLMYITDLNVLYKEHECLWNYRKYLVIHLIKFLYEYHGLEFEYKLCMKNEVKSNTSNILTLNFSSIIDINMKNDIPKKVKSTELYKALIVSETEFVENNKSSVNLSQNNLAIRYWNWLKCTNFFND